MVFKGQDAWRKHPLLVNRYKQPFPGLKLAVIIFAGYFSIDLLLNSAVSSAHYRTKNRAAPAIHYRKDEGGNAPVIGEEH